MSDLRKYIDEIRDSYDIGNDDFRMPDHLWELCQSAEKWAVLLDVVEAGGRIIAETPCPHGEFEDGHLIKGGHPESSIAYCATYPERRVVLGDDT